MPRGARKARVAPAAGAEGNGDAAAEAPAKEPAPRPAS
jgi:hypothetical protein